MINTQDIVEVAIITTEKAVQQLAHTFGFQQKTDQLSLYQATSDKKLPVACFENLAKQGNFVAVFINACDLCEICAYGEVEEEWIKEAILYRIEEEHLRLYPVCRDEAWLETFSSYIELDPINNPYNPYLVEVQYKK